MIWNIVLVQNVYTANRRLCLDVDDWQDTRVIAEVPSDVEGVPDQTAQVLLTTNGGLTSNALGLKFVDTRETVQLTNQPVQYNTACDQQTEQDSCGPAGGDYWAGSVFSFGNTGTDRSTSCSPTAGSCRAWRWGARTAMSRSAPHRPPG